jgi:hypothetical protein
MIIRDIGKEKIEITDDIVMKECKYCLNYDFCEPELNDKEIQCYFLYSLYTKGESFREEFKKELQDELNQE